MLPNALVQDLSSVALPAGRSAETLSRITDLFVRDAERFSDEHIAVFDEVIGLLADRIESYARAALAERLADIPNAPPVIIGRLARDEIAIARPILERSRRLDHDDLVEIAMTFGQGHLLAISSRPHLPETVTDVLIERGDKVVLHATARNDTARISPRGYGGLVARARNDEALQGLLGKRRDLPMDRLQELVSLARAQVRERLLETMRERSRDILERAIEAGSQQVEAEIEATVSPPAEIFTGEAADLAREGRLDEMAVRAFAADGRKREATVGLALLGELPERLAERVFTEAQDDLLLIVCKALDFHWDTVQVLAALKAGAPTRPSEQSRLESSYQTLSRLTAQRVVRFLHAREAIGGPGR